MKKTVEQWAQVVQQLEVKGEKSEHGDSLFELAYDIEQDLYQKPMEEEVEIMLTKDQTAVIKYVSEEG